MEFNNKNTSSFITGESQKTISYRKKSESNNIIKSFTSHLKRNKAIINLKSVIKTNKNITKQKLKLFPQLQLKLEKNENNINKGNHPDKIAYSDSNKNIKIKKHLLPMSRNENLPKKSNLFETFETLINIKRKMITLNASKLRSPLKTIYHSYTKTKNRSLSNTVNKNNITSYHKKNANFSENQKRIDGKVKRRISRKKLEVIRTMDNHIKYIHKIRDKEMILLINRYRKEMKDNKRIGINHYCNSVYPVAMIQYLIKTKNDLTIDKYRNEYLNKIDRYKTTVISKLIKDNNTHSQ